MDKMEKTEKELMQAINQSSIKQYVSVAEALRNHLSRHLILNIWLKSVRCPVGSTELINIFKLLGIDIPDDF